jgi:FkbM family methyltransferase
MLNGKYKFNLPKHREKQWANPWEPERLDALYANIKKGTVVYDIGSEEGDIPALMATWGAEVVCVEPSPYYWPRIRDVFQMNDVVPAGVYQGFASDVTVERNQEMKMGWPIATFGESREGFRHLAQETATTDQITIDDLVKRLGVVPDIINIDTEGSELNVLKGAREVLIKHKPDVLVSIHPEILKEWYHSTEEELYKYMEDLGYKRKHLATDHEIHTYFYE